MATQPDDDEPLELTEELEPDEPHVEEEADGDDPSIDDEGDEPASVSFDGEEPTEPEPENSTVRQMRKALREKDRELSELRKQSAPKPIEVGDEPDFEDPKYEWDQAKFKADYDAWKDRKAAAERQQQTHAEQSRQANDAWQADLSAYEQKKATLEFEDREDVIDTATSAFPTPWHVPAIIKAAADPALFLYALGKSDAKRDELAKINDPIKLAAAVARMEGAVKVTKGRKAPEPDRPLSGSARMPGNVDKELERLEKKAASTGVRSELIAYKKKNGLL